jgi:hypothetical protein
MAVVQLVPPSFEIRVVATPSPTAMQRVVVAHATPSISPPATTRNVAGLLATRSVAASVPSELPIATKPAQTSATAPKILAMIAL